MINWSNIKELKSQLKNDVKEEKKEIDLDRCKYCKKFTIINNKENLLCTNCGVIQGENMDTTQEWSYYKNSDSNKSDPTRCGGVVNLYIPNASLSLNISGPNSKLKSIHNRYMITYKEKSLLNIFDKTKKNASKENISVYIVELAEKYYTLLGSKSNKRITKDNFMAACLYYTCRDKNNIKTYIEVANIFNIKSKNMTKGCNIFRELLYYYYSQLLNRIKPLNIEDFINRYSMELDLDNKLREKAISVGNYATYLGLTFKNTPISIAIGCLYLIIKVNGIKITKKELHEKTSISDVTILKCYNKLNKYKKYLL